MLEIITVEHHFTELHQVSRELSLEEIASKEIQQLASELTETAEQHIRKKVGKVLGSLQYR